MMEIITQISRICLVLQLIFGDGHGQYGGYGIEDGMEYECCPTKKIWGNPDPNMNGMFYLVEMGSVSPMCNSPCIYMKKDGEMDGQKFCFANSMTSNSKCLDGGDNACYELSVGKIANFKKLWRDYVPYFDMIPVPDFPAMLSYENISLNSNDSINTDDCLLRPYVKWSKAISGELEEDPLYTIIQIDVSIQNNQTYIHWMKVNVNGTDSLTGEENMEYTPTFAFRSCNNGTTNHGDRCPRYIIDDPNYQHVFVTLVLRQTTGRIEVDDEEKQNGCNPDLLSPKIRFVNFDWMNNFITKYNLILEAGHFFQSPYTKLVDKLICFYVSCVPPNGTDPPFPGHVVEGVNDLPACEPFTGDPTAPIDYMVLKED